jgi:hypothetical protein
MTDKWKQTADSRQQRKGRQQTVDSRQQIELAKNEHETAIADRRPQTTNSRQQEATETSDSRQKGDNREQT